MSIEKNIERIADALEKLLEVAKDAPKAAPKRTRSKPKVEAVPEVAPIEEVEPVAKVEETQPEVAVEVVKDAIVPVAEDDLLGEELTLDDCKAALLGFIQDNGIDKARAVMQEKFSVAKLTLLNKSQYPKCLQVFKV